MARELVKKVVKKAKQLRSKVKGYYNKKAAKSFEVRDTLRRAKNAMAGLKSRNENYSKGMADLAENFNLADADRAYLAGLTNEVRQTALKHARRKVKTKVGRLVAAGAKKEMAKHAAIGAGVLAAGAAGAYALKRRQNAKKKTR